jgi:hypothetical protein
MGKFYFTPTANTTYKVEIEEYPESNPKLPKIRTKGSKIIVAKANKEYIKLNLISSDEKPTKPFFIACMHRGEGNFFMKIMQTQIRKTIEIETNTFKEGINRIVLLNSGFEPLSERMVFLPPENDINLKLKPNQDQY